jgi:inner membrane protein
LDPLTHGLLGAGLGYAAFGGKLGRSAAVAGALAALLPDIDVFIRSADDPLLAIEHHRGFTHSLIFAPVGAAVVATLAWWRKSGTGTWATWWACCLVGYLSHCLLDASTSYGTQLLWPFSNQRAGWDLISIIDPPFTLVLGIGLVVALGRRRRGFAVAAIGLAALYLVAGGFQHRRALAVQADLAAARGHVRERFEVMPTLGNNLVWRALYVHAGRMYSDRIRVGWFGSAAVREGWSLPVVDERELTPAERARDGTSRSFARFQWFSEGWVSRNPARLMILGDMRYSLSTEAFDPVWGIRFTQPDEPTAVAWVNRTQERRIDGAELWREIIGRDPRFVPR